MLGPDAGGRGAAAGLALATPGAAAVAPGVEYGAYLGGLRRRIQESLQYPLAARRRGLGGTVVLEILIGADGAIGAVSLVGSSSHRVLDEAALEAVRGVGPAPFPPDLAARPLRVRLPVVFELR
jgi:protein TonB